MWGLQLPSCFAAENEVAANWLMVHAKKGVLF